MRTKEELEALIAEECEAAEATGDVLLSGGRRRSGGSAPKSVVYSIRMSPDEVEKISAAAQAAGKIPSALVREWILEKIADGPSVEDRLSALEIAVEKVVLGAGRSNSFADYKKILPGIKVFQGTSLIKAPKGRRATSAKSSIAVQPDRSSNR